MKVCVIQPRYSFDPAHLDQCYLELIALLDQCTDEPDEARRYFEMGFDTVLTNDYLTIANEYKKLYEKRNKE